MRSGGVGLLKIREFVGASQPHAKKCERGLLLSLKRQVKGHIIIEIPFLFTYMKYFIELEPYSGYRLLVLSSDELVTLHSPS